MDGANPSSNYGSDWAIRVAAELTQDGYTVAAPWGTGIASDAIQGARLEGGHPIVVAPHPLAPPYVDKAAPARNGLFLSELPPGPAITPQMGDHSHRILAATSGVFTVAEAWNNSRPVTTARLAASLGREVAALPSDVTRATRGSNQLIAERTATLVTDTEDIERLLEKDERPALSPFAIEQPAIGRAQVRARGPAR